LPPITVIPINEFAVSDIKMKMIEDEWLEKALNLHPVNIAEERFLKYKRDYDRQTKEILFEKIQRYKDTQFQIIRNEEKNLAKTTVFHIKNELNMMHNEKCKSLEKKEANIMKFLEEKENQLNMGLIEHNQKATKDLIILQQREQELKRNEEIFQQKVKVNLDQISIKEKELAEKLIDVENIKNTELLQVNTEIEKLIN